MHTKVSRLAALAVGAILSLVLVAEAAAQLVIAHRGASGERPEHTLAAYELGARQGADFIEPDLVPTKDGVLVARHENEISGTTDVAQRPEFADRRTTKTVDGVTLTGWFTEDFTLAEIKTLRAKERIPDLRPQNVRFDGRFEVPTFAEVLELRKRLSKELHRPIGVYPETKHPTYFDGLGLSLEEPLVKDLRRGGLQGKRDLVFIQSFEDGNLRELSTRTKFALVQLVSPAQRARTTPAGLADVAAYADGIGPDKTLILPRDATGRSLAPTPLVDDAHRAGLLVHPYTFRVENTFLALERRSGPDPAAPGDLDGEIRQFLELGVDGFFTDNPDLGVRARGGR